MENIQPYLKLTNPDNSLIQRCLQQDRTAQRLLYEKYKSAMFSVAYRILANYEDANDALQEAFIAAFTDLSSFR